MTEYVAGYMFSPDLSRVALIKKNKPAWQAGLLNGIGGKVEPGETAHEAMVREFGEETGCETTMETWRQYCDMGGTNLPDNEAFQVSFFAAVGDLGQLRTVTGEALCIVNVQEIHPLRKDLVENVPWLVPLAIDHLCDRRPSYVEASYTQEPYL
jgi:8-oxo-dGTP diphosphatase